MTDTQTAAWHLYVALHWLAAAQVHGEIPTTEGGMGDLDHARHQLTEHGPALAREHPQLADGVRHVIDTWTDDPAGRLATLLPVMDTLASVSGVSLPETLPPITVMR
ncbi:hypothetical protein FCH28_37670 [Streptomyces piniterrae]|uniref:Uncharacterized protein n=1 Tax=Streptomyces piniterrae TaxID=2571125 RepID=A0A4U0ML81_9ACTN|nr:hypothetical protein [Streptomyces piniterrae]TJZ41216.1 hypothetical protein FCH28_37670 [Streptomyces piniterrae]